jgi:putative FmdB family regulatory protein
VPLYDYVCAACSRSFEVIHGVHGDPPTSCPLCGRGPVRKAITAPAVHYKGSGWAKKERRAEVKTGSSSTGGVDESASDSGSSSSESGSSKESGSSGTDTGSSPVVPAASTTGESSKGASKSSKSGTATKPPGRDRD